MPVSEAILKRPRLMEFCSSVYTNTLWNLLAITPTTNVDARLLCTHVGADSLLGWSGLCLEA